MSIKSSVAALCIALLGTIGAASAQTVYQDNFTGASSTNNWATFNGACLTAGDGSGNIPKCAGLPYYGGEALVGGDTGSLPDLLPVAGNLGTGGALRFTNGYPGGYHQNGAVVSNFVFPTNQGLEVTFTTVTYRGDSGNISGGAVGDGADGISFFLMDGNSPPDLGAFGGSLGYSCSNTNNDSTMRNDFGVMTQRGYDGLVGAYIGLGIDEFGNFLNQGDNTASGFGPQQGRIGMRGAGSVAWRSLNQNYPAQYPSSLSTAQRAAAVQLTCSTGQIWDFSSNPSGVATTQPVTPAFLDYPTIPNAFKVLPSTLQIANEAAMVRKDATPITYKVRVSSNGLLSFYYSYNGGAFQSVIQGQDITASNGAVPTKFRFGFAGSTGGSSNIHEILCFAAAPSNQTASSAAANQKQSTQVQIGTQAYFAFYNPTTWAGSLTSNSIVADTTTGNLSIAATANWDASCVLTGVGPAPATCAATTVSGPTPAEAPATRSILTWNGTRGIPFEWSNLTSAQQATLDQGDASVTPNRLSFLRGDRSNEITSLGVGIYRDRASVLGDIIDSGPLWVGPPIGTYSATWSDSIYPANAAPENSGQSYPTFITSKQTRTNVVYIGANDGLLHGFRTGAYNAANLFDASKPNDGLELLAYMPGAVVNTIHNATDPSIDFSNPQYGHNFYVDAPPASGDLFYAGAWHTWVMGGLGAGGAAIYALEVTDPTQFAESNAASIVKGEWSSTTLTCVNLAGCRSNLGNTYGSPSIRRFHNGSWGAVMGNGLGSATGDSGIYIMLVDPTSGAISFYYLSTNVAANGGNGGIAYASPADMDGDNIVDYVYAGDVLGHVWRFDLTDKNPANWSAGSSPLFTTPVGQPITTRLVATGVAQAHGGAMRVLIEFGTGRQFPFTNTSATSYATGSQALYGIWDSDFTNWNSKGSVQFVALPAPQTISATGANANLTVQSVTTTFTPSVTAVASAFRSLSANVVCWNGSTSCTAGNNQMGWTLPLPGGNEQVIFNPTLLAGAFIVNTLIPANNSPLSCDSSSPTGWTMAIFPGTGGASSTSFFLDQNHHPITNADQPANGAQMNATGTPSDVFNNGQGYLLQQTSGSGTSGASGTGGTGGGGNNNNNNNNNLQGHGTLTGQANRLTWIERR